jgi:hypothetical protein
LFARHGRVDLGDDLIRTYDDMQHKRLRRDYSARNPRKPRIERPEGVQQAIDGITDMIASAIPDRKAELLKDIETILFYVGEHGGREDRAWLEQVRREIWMERRA